MSKYKVISLNYITSGKNKVFVNMDLSTDFAVDYSNRILEGIKSSSDGRKKVLTEHRTGHEISADFISKDDINGKREDDMIALENNVSSVLLGEKQPYREYEDGQRTAIKIYTQRYDYMSYQQILDNYADRIKSLRNKTFIYERQSSDVVGKVNGILSAQEKTFPIYDITDVCMKSSNKHGKSNMVSMDSFEQREDIYVPQFDKNPIQFVQVGKNTYMLHGNTDKGTVTLKSSLEEQRNENDGIQWFNMTLDERKTEIGLYKTPENIVKDPNNPDFEIEDTYMGMEIGIVSKFNMEDRYDYLHGNEYCDIFETKSFYDENYDMNVSKTEGSLEYNNCRNYLGIGKYGNSIYLKYDNGKNYSEGETKDNPKKDYQKIETVLENSTKVMKNHKSNMFSIRIKNTKFGNEEQYEELKDVKYRKLKKDIMNAIRSISDNVSPANTTLIDIQFRG